MINEEILKTAKAMSTQLVDPKAFRKELQERCYVIWDLSGFDIHCLPKTPVIPSCVNLAETENKLLYGALLATHFELDIWPVVYEGENEGHLIRHVCPMITEENAISSYGGKYDFYPHVDNPDLPISGEPINPKIGNSPDTLTFLCLRKEEGVNTSLLLIDEVLNHLDAETIEILQRPEFKVARPASFRISHVLEGVPGLVKKHSVFYSRFDFHNVSDMNPSAERAIDQLRHVSLLPELWFNAPLEPGKAITFLNQRTLHSRNAFKPRFDGTDRWLLHIFGTFKKPLVTQLVDAELCKYHLKAGEIHNE